jgi:hypothetical protein
MRAAIVDRLRAALSLGDAYIQEHRFSALQTEHVLPVIKNTPIGLRVAFNGSDTTEWSSDEVDIMGMWSIYLVARDDTGTGALPRDEVLLGILPAVLHVVAHSDWDADEDYEPLQHRGKAERVRVVPLYEGTAEAKSALIWAVQWRQLLVLPPADDADIRAFTKLITKYDLAPADGVFEAEDEITLG